MSVAGEKREAESRSGGPVHRRRRRWSEAQKRQIVVESHEPGGSVSVVVRRYNVNANQVGRCGGNPPLEGGARDYGLERRGRPSPVRAFEIAIFRFPISDLLASNQTDMDSSNCRDLEMECSSGF